MRNRLIYEFDTDYEHYQVIDTLYEGRKARVLYSGQHSAVQSGLALDKNPELLFDYNARFFELISYVNPTRVLLIGGGVYTFPQKIINTYSDIRIDVIEIDSQLEDVARKYFGFESNPRLVIINDDGRKFLQNTKNKYDLVLIDAFTHLEIPRQLITKQAIAAVYKCLTKNGIVAMNIISAYEGMYSSILHQIYAAYDTKFHYIDIVPADNRFSVWQRQNFILVASKRIKDAAQYIKYGPLYKLPTHKNLILND